jgi:hypothetical protein
MQKTMAFIGMTVGGAVGWWLGNFAGIFGAVAVSAVGTGVGLYYGRKLADDFLP